MILHRLGLINKNQRGFTLIEMLVVVAITGLITGGVGTTIFQIFSINTLNSNHMLAVRQMQNAGYWLSHDAQMAQSIDAEPVIISNGHPLYPQAGNQTQVLSLSWAGWEYEYGPNPNIRTNFYTVYYTYDADNSKFWRYETISFTEYADGELIDPQPGDQNSTTLIAEYLSPMPDGNMDGDKLVVTISATVGDTTETRTYEITPRPST